MPTSISGIEYLRMYGPTTGDRVRLADTSLSIMVERDYANYGDEVLVGWAKNARNGMMILSAQASASELDTVVLGATILDPVLGVFKGSIGVKGDRIVAIGNAGNPDIADNIDVLIGPGTNIIPGGNLIATPGGVDTHVHAVTPRIVPSALDGGVTTLIGGGLSQQPAANLHTPLLAMEGFPVNVGFQARASSHMPSAIQRYLLAGACGFKVHEDMGAYAPIIDNALTVADLMDVAVCLHTDGLNESMSSNETISAIDGRTIHAYHVEGSGGGHTPDALLLATKDHIIASSTTPTIPFGVGAVPEHLDMMTAVHGTDPALEETREAIKLRIRAPSMEAETLLHDMGAISIINSDSQGMGRVQETVRRTWQLAHVNKIHAQARGELPPHDNVRVLQYLAKYTINAARTHGIHREVGSLEPGKMADIVLWDPRFFGVKPDLVIKGGQPAWGLRGDGNGSIKTVQPLTYGPMWGGLGKAIDRVAVNFVSAASIDEGLQSTLGGSRKLVSVQDCRDVRKQELIGTSSSPNLDFDSETGEVYCAGTKLSMEAVQEFKLNRTYLLS